MIKKNIALVFFVLTQFIWSQPKNYKNTDNSTLNDAFPKHHEKVFPGCLSKEQLQDFKTFLATKWNIQLDSITTLNIYFSKDEKECKSLDHFVRIKEGKMYFRFDHSYNVTSVKDYLLLIKPEAVKANTLWKNDLEDYFSNLFLKEQKRKFYTAAITVNSKGIYFIDFEVFNPIVFNAFSNEVNKFSCE